MNYPASTTMNVCRAVKDGLGSPGLKAKKERNVVDWTSEPLANSTSTYLMKFSRLKTTDNGKHGRAPK